MFFILSNEVRQERHKACALDRAGQLTLVPSTYAGTLTWNYFTKGGEIATQGIGILVVNLLDVHFAEETGLLLLSVFHRLERDIFETNFLITETDINGFHGRGRCRTWAIAR